jgi:hypothetical protein
MWGPESSGHSSGTTKINVLDKKTLSRPRKTPKLETQIEYLTVLIYTPENKNKALANNLIEFYFHVWY